MTRAFFSSIEPPASLLGAVLARIAHVRRRAARLRLATLGVLVTVSAAALVPAVSYTTHEFYTSGFYDYSALLFSDRSLALTYSRDMAFSLLESVPSLAVLLLLGFSIALIWSLRRALRAAPMAFMPLTASHG